MRILLGVVLAGLVALMVLGRVRSTLATPGGPASAAAAADGPVEVPGVTQISVAELAQRIQRPMGRPSIVVLYGPRCPISQRVFPQLSSLARFYGPRGIDFQAYSTDADADAAEIIPFLAKHQAPFKPIHVRHWGSGGLDAALSPLGIVVGDTWTRPLVVIRDAGGRIVAQGQGVGDLSGLEQALANGALQAAGN